MRSFKIGTALVLLTMFTFGCVDQQPAGPEIETTVATPMSNFMNGPDSSGLYVIREDGNPRGLFFAEGATGRQILVGNDPRLICTPPFGNPREFVEIQRTMPPGVAAQVKDLIHGDDMMAQVWGFPAFDCGQFLTTDPLVEGLVDLRSNNLIEFMAGNGPTSFGFNVHGAFNAHIRCHEDPKINDITCNAKILIP